MALPAHLGGLGIINPSERSASHHTTCETITAPLVTLILNQSEAYTPETKAMQTRAKNNACSIRRHCESRTASELKSNPPNHLQKALTVSSEGTSSWLFTFFISEHGFALHKGAFRDGIHHIYPPIVFAEASLRALRHRTTHT